MRQYLWGIGISVVAVLACSVAQAQGAGVRVGVPLVGATAWGEECRGNCDSIGLDQYDGDDVSTLSLAVDFFIPVVDHVLLGVGSSYVAGTRVGVEGGGEVDFGSDVGIFGFVDTHLPLSPTETVVLRAQGGMALLVPDGMLTEVTDEISSNCEQLDFLHGSCSVDDGTQVGWTAGGSIGVRFPLSSVAVRTDFLFTYTDVPLYSVVLTNPYGATDAILSTRLQAKRAFLTLGIELGSI